MRVWTVLALVAVALLAAACSSGADSGGPTGSVGRSQEAEAAGVSVDATWLDPEAAAKAEVDLSAYPSDEFVLLEVGFSTHSGDLNEIDMEKEARLQWGAETLGPERWLSISDDSHHRQGILVFQRREAGGPVKLVIGVKGEELTLTWPSEPGGS